MDESENQQEEPIEGEAPEGHEAPPPSLATSIPPPSSPEPETKSAALEKPKILCVDDEPYVLEGLSVNLRRMFEVYTASGGQEALNLIANNSAASFPVIISDMRMPGMDGATFLGKARQLSPDSIRMLLSGHSDLEAAVRAVNEGRIFRYLSKPFPAKQLAVVCKEALAQYRLVKAQKDVLEQTLWGSVNVLTQILSMVNPAAFGRTTRILTVVRHLVNRLKLTEVWQFEVAAMLSQVGCVTLPPDTLARIDAAGPLSPKEREIYRNHPQISADLIKKIPRLEDVAEMIRRQLETFRDDDFSADVTTANKGILGAQLLRLAVDLGRLSLKGHSTEEAVNVVQRRGQFYHPALLNALEGLDLPTPKLVPKYAKVADLTLDMILDENVETTAGVSVVSKGNAVTQEILDRLERFGQGGGIKEPFRVLIKL